MTPLASNVPISAFYGKLYCLVLAYTVQKPHIPSRETVVRYMDTSGISDNLNTLGSSGVLDSSNTSESSNIPDTAASCTDQHQYFPQIDPIHFGTDGWRAIIGEDFNPQSLARAVQAAALTFRRQALAKTASEEAGLSEEPKPSEEPSEKLPDDATILVGYDCRLNAGRYASLAATVIASAGFKVQISDRYCPTPALCWTIAHDPCIVGGLMLTSSHNPAEYLGIKLRMSDGGASPQAFTNEVEATLSDGLPECFDEALKNYDEAVNGTPDEPAIPLEAAPYLHFTDIMSAYLDALRASVDTDLIKASSLKLVIDPMYGAGRSYLANLLREMGAEVLEINCDNDPSFKGLHPEPILPWVKDGLDTVAEFGFDACFITDGDADRIGAADGTGTYVTSHRLLALLIGHLVEGRGLRGRVVRTQAGSNLLRRLCDRLGLTLTTCPIGFKWIYEEMLVGDVLIGGEESGGMGIPSHVLERDGLLMALMLSELMAKKGKKLKELVDEMLALLGTLEYKRHDLRLTPEQKELFLKGHVNSEAVLPEQYQEMFAPLGEQLIEIKRGDGIKFSLASDAWLLIRPSGTEPLVRVYAEADSNDQVQSLLDLGCSLAQSC